MNLQKINVKFFVADPGAVQLEPFVGIFNSWIQAADGEYYDLADYSHVPDGPGILLIAHEANISMDNSGNELGLLYNRKQPLEGSNREKLRRAFAAALQYCRRIEAESVLEGRLHFRGGEALVLINDRLLAPNTEETLGAIRADVEDLVRTLYAGSEFSLQREQDPRKRFGLRIKTPVSFDVATLLKNMESSVN
ncbi:MAG TPA: hypothetical protein VGL11_20080 [Candidatus Binatia bacterium]|jgi:hypothetical protein